MDKFRFIALTGFALLAFGCRYSDNTLHVKDSLITVGAPHQLPPGTLPFAISRDGSKVAVFENVSDVTSLEGNVDLRVLDSTTFAPLGKPMPQEDFRGIAFDPTGTRLYVPQGEKYVAWDYANGTFEPVADTVPDIAPIDPWDVFSNLDHSIVYAKPGASSFYQRPNPKATEGTDGRVLAGNRSYAIPFTHKLGFDSAGDFWYQVGSKWTKVSRDGQKTQPSTGPKSLIQDQTKVSGTLHLDITSTEMKYKDAVARVQSLWLTDDKPTRDPINPQAHYQAALVFTGSDIFDYGFVPQQKMVYVVTATGSFFIPYESTPDAGRKKRPKVPTLREAVGQ